MTDDEKKLKALRDEMPPPIAAHTNGMVIAVYKGPHPSTQFPSEAAALFYLEAHRLVPSLFARIEELEKCSDPALVDRLVQDVAAQGRENAKLAEHVRQLEIARANEANEHAQTKARLREAKLKIASYASAQTREPLSGIAAQARVVTLEAELAKVRADLDSVLPSIRENLETISKQETLLQQTMETCRIAVYERDAAVKEVQMLGRVIRTNKAGA